MKKISLFFVISLFTVLGIKSQTTRYVSPDGLCGGNSPCYTTIQAAINAAVAGDIILVSPGSYNESVNINKSNLTILSTSGASNTIIVGTGSLSGSVFITSNVNGIRFGAIGQGFTIKGIDGTAAVEKAAFYFGGSHTNVTVEDNIIEAIGDAAMMGVYNASMDNIVINKNQFTGQTFLGANPSGVGFSAQYTLPNVPRQAVVFGGSTSTTNTKNFTFTNNIISTITGGMSYISNTGAAQNPLPQGNCLVTLDLVGTNTISGNVFSGTIGTYTSSYALRIRGSGVYNIYNNVFNGNYLLALYSQNTVNVTNNYWGTPKGPKIASNTCGGIYSITSNASYEPWYSDAALTTLVYRLVAYTVSGSATICDGISTNINLSNSQNGNQYEYQLYNGSNAVGMPIKGTGSNLTFSANSAGTYTVKATNLHSTCTLNMSGSATITSRNRPTANITGGTDNSVVVALTGTAPWSGQLSDGTNFNVNSSPANITVNPVNTTTYTVNTLNDAYCSANQSDLTGSHTIVTKVAAPVFNPIAGNYYAPVNVSITSATNDAQIKYTLDGSTPSLTNGIVYSNPFTLNASATVKAIGIKSGLTQSDVSEAVYTIFIDSDGDGVIDQDDDYPSDSTRAFDNMFPANGYGTLAFEDSWPNKGDYDMNDVVVDYRFKNVVDANNKLVETYATFILKASGAGFNNGFGFQFANNQININEISASGYILKSNYINVGNNGFELNQNKPTVIVFDNAFEVLQHPGVGTGVNTTPGLPYVTPVTITIHITYPKNTYTEEQLDIANFNPFIIVNKNRNKEVHLPDYPPTALVNPAFFGTYDDNSIPTSNRYYKTSKNLPWALNIYDTFEYPIEKTPIIEAYPYFVDWVMSDGNQYADWYKDITGYRNMNKIFTPPVSNLKKTIKPDVNKRK